MNDLRMREFLKYSFSSPERIKKEESERKGKKKAVFKAHF